MIKLAENWKDYAVIATGNGEKLERWGDLILLRPDPQVIWKSAFDLRSYAGINAVYTRSRDGGGSWQIGGGMPAEFVIERAGLQFKCKLMGFKHTGLFPEQAVNWDILSDLIRASGKKPRVLNLFAYTGGATVALAKAGAVVCHVDSAKAMVDRAKENCRLSGVDPANTRFIVDDCMKFVEREIRRGNRYDAVIMDPPSYGRGTNGEMWKLEDQIYALIEKTRSLLSDDPLFYLINSYTTGLQPTVMQNLLNLLICEGRGMVDAYETCLPTEEKQVILPCGCSALWIND